MNQYQYFRKIINLIASLLKEFLSLTEQEVNDILDEKVAVKLTLHPKNSKQLDAKIKTTVKKVAHPSEENTNPIDSPERNSSEQLRKAEIIIAIEEIAEKLKKAGTREEGFEILDNYCQKRKDLENLAVCIDIPNHKKDNISILRDRIIEATIGYRLRSRAIQGEPISTKTEKIGVEVPESDPSKTAQDETILMSTEKLNAET